MNPKFFLVGGYVRGKENPHDIDIVGVVSKEEFKREFGYDHQSLMDAFKESPRPDKLERYLLANKIAGNVLTTLFGEKKNVDFKWCLPTMLYKPNCEIRLTLTSEMEI